MATPEQTLTVKRRRLPHWTFPGSTYYITFRLQTAPLIESEISIVLSHIKGADKKFYALLAATVMPDHVHMILTPNTDVELSRVMKGIKGVSSRQLNLSRKTKANNWQDESFDRIIRNEDEFKEKLNYMYMNPVKKGLTDDPEKYIGWYFNAAAAGYGGGASV